MSERQRQLIWVVGVGAIVIALDATVPGVHAIVLALLAWLGVAVAVCAPVLALILLARLRQGD